MALFVLSGMVLAMAAATGCGRDNGAEKDKTPGSVPGLDTNVVKTAADLRRDFVLLTRQLRENDGECRRLELELRQWRESIITNEVAIQTRLAADPQWARLRADLAAAQRNADQRQQRVAAARLAQMRQQAQPAAPAADAAEAGAAADSLVELNRAFDEASRRVRSEDGECRALVAANRDLRQAMAGNEAAIQARLAANHEWARLERESRDADLRYRQARRAQGLYLREPGPRPAKPLRAETQQP